MDRWSGQFTCTFRDLQRLEDGDLQQMVNRNCAMLLRDTRNDLDGILIETFTDRIVRKAIYVREYIVFLESGLWWKVPSVRIRLVYDRRGRGCGKVDMSQGDFLALYSVYFPTLRREHSVVQGLEGQLYPTVKSVRVT